ncbi:MAG TPA: hypothetical protein VGV38_17345 [Pyrinomonadaceae bacterium]|nr:hypothetical protein [Pyrinomonadaceae bacterium]
MSAFPHSPHAIVEVGGERFDSWVDTQLFENVDADLTTNEASAASWTVFDDDDFAFLDRWTSADGIAELPFKVSLGFGVTPRLVFDGLLARVERGPGTTTFRAYDRSLPMRKVQKTEYHRNLDDVQIISKLARRNGLAFEGPVPAVRLDKHKSEKQEAQTDWDYASQRAEEAGLVLYVRGGTLYAKEAARTGDPVLTLAYGRDVFLLDDYSLSFKVPENQEGRPAKVEVRGRGRGGRRLQGRAQEHERGTEHVQIKRDLRIGSKRQADRRAEARKALQREHAFTCSVNLLPAFEGELLDVRMTVALAELGKLFSGKYLIDRAHYTFAPGRMEGSLELYRDIR